MNDRTYENLCILEIPMKFQANGFEYLGYYDKENNKLFDVMKITENNISKIDMILWFKLWNLDKLDIIFMSRSSNITSKYLNQEEMNYWELCKHRLMLSKKFIVNHSENNLFDLLMTKSEI